MNNKRKEWLVLGGVSIYYFILSLYKFLQAPIWGDELVEYYTAIFTRGPIHGITNAPTMYERILTMQQQPPLYSWILGLWVLISNGEFWLRFSSVVFCFGSVIGIYFIIKKIADYRIAGISVIVFSSMYQIQYYVKEAAEYALLMPILFGVIYWFLCGMEERCWKNILIFTLFSVAAVSTQYGAIFMVVPMALMLLVKCIKEKNWEVCKKTVIAYGISALGVGVPLLIFYIIPQAANPVSTLGVEHTVEFEKNIFYDFLLGIVSTFDWQYLDFDRDGARMLPVVWVFTIIFIIVSVYLFIKKKSKFLNYLLTALVFTYVFYYILLKVKIYGYGWFGLRYSICLLPIFYICINVVIITLFKEVASLCNKKLYKGLIILFIFCLVGYCCYGIYRVHNHWWKSDERGVVQYWYDKECSNELTLVDFKQRLTFLYYLQENDAYDSEYLDSVYFNLLEESVEYSIEEWIAYIDESMGIENLPKKFYLSTGYYNNLVQALEQLGYHAEDLIDTTTEFYLLSKE